MHSEHYRYYRLDGAGHLHEAEWFDAESDENAAAKIEAKYPDARREIWQGTRLVATLTPSIAVHVRASPIDERSSGSDLQNCSI